MKRFALTTICGSELLSSVRSRVQEIGELQGECRKHRDDALVSFEPRSGVSLHNFSRTPTSLGRIRLAKLGRHAREIPIRRFRGKDCPVER